MNIGIIGDGQLGRMLALSGIPLGLKFGFLGAKDSPSGHLGEVFNNLKDLETFSDVLTFESENTDIDWIKSLKKPVFPNEKSLWTAQHRGREKSLFKTLNIPCAPYQLINSEQELQQAVTKIGLPGILKTTTEGYDGKGQFLIKDPEQISQAYQSMQGVQAIFEGFVTFKRELSLIAVRNQNNEHKYYPLVENFHHDSILRLTLAPAKNINTAIQQQAEKYMQALLEELDYVGVLSLELFQTENGLVANEIAPRVHNSGHWSMEGTNCSQFENHIRAIAGLPLGDTKPIYSHNAMINIISELGETNSVLNHADAHLHLYDKSERKNRKLGHINLNSNSETMLNTSLENLKNYLPKRDSK
jgi:5-(carboxyamino)imidazole ribonucleotide synthase